MNWCKSAGCKIVSYTSYSGRLLKGSATLHSFVLQVLLVAAAKILSVKVGTSIDQPACLPCRSTCLVGPSALSVCLPCLVPSTSVSSCWSGICCQLICLEQYTLLRCTPFFNIFYFKVPKLNLHWKGKQKKHFYLLKHVIKICECERVRLK